MKFIVIFMSLAVYTMAQRPSYAGTRPIGRPELANRFKDSTDPPAPSSPDLGNRVGESGSTERIPVDARGDSELVNRLNSWPRENRPFWLLNAEQIEAQRGQTAEQQLLANRNNFANQETITILPEPHRSPFLPPLNRRR